MVVVVGGYLSFGTWWLQRAGCKVAAVAHANSVNFGPAPSSWERAIELVMQCSAAANRYWKQEKGWGLFTK